MGNSLAVLQMKASQFKRGSVVLITGASQGIGREIALRYALRDCKLLLCARNEKALRQVQDLCVKLGSQAEICVTDVTSEGDCRRMVEACLKYFGGIDILVLNAGVNAHSRFADIDDLEVFRKVMETNFFGYLYTTKFAWEELKKSKGQIVVLSSLSGEIGLPFRSAYCSSKFAVTGFFEALRTEIPEGQSVDITIVCPPSVRSKMREHDLLADKNGGRLNEDHETDTRMTVEHCVDTIMVAADTRARKVFFPMMAYVAAYLRPLFPDFVDKRLKKAAKL